MTDFKAKKVCAKTRRGKGKKNESELTWSHTNHMSILINTPNSYYYNNVAEQKLKTRRTSAQRPKVLSCLRRFVLEELHLKSLQNFEDLS
jgi:hypothetical protein